MRSPSPPTDSLSGLFVSFVLVFVLFGGAVWLLPLVTGWVGAIAGEVR